MRVEFIRNDTPYRKGAVHDLPDAEAEKFIRHGTAREVEAKPEKAKPRVAKKKVRKR